MKKKNNILPTKEEINSMMRELKTLEIEDMADRAKIIERSKKLEKQDQADLTQLMARGGKVKHKKGGGFTYRMGGKVKTMSENMKEMLGGREFLEANFQGGGSVQDIMLMNVNPMTSMQQLMGYGGMAKKYQGDGKVTEEYYKIGGKEVSKEVYDLYTDGGTKIYMGPDGLIPWQEAEGVKVEKEPSDLTSDLVKSIDEKSVTNPPVIPQEPTRTLDDDYEFTADNLFRQPTVPMEGAPIPVRTGPPYTDANPNPNPNSGIDIDDDYIVPNPNDEIDFNNLGEIDYSVDPTTNEPLNDPRDPRRDPLTREILDQSDMQTPATVENVEPLTREILDQSDIRPTTGNIGDIDRNNDGMPDYLQRQPGISTLPIQQIPNITDPNDIQLPQLSTTDPSNITTSGGDLQAEAAERYGFEMDMDPESPTYGEYFKGEDQLKYNENIEMWTPGSMMDLPSVNNVAKPQQTIKELLEGMDLKKNLPDYLGGAGSAISGLGPLMTTLKQGIDTDETNYFENVEDDAVAEQEKALGVFDDGKEQARRVIDRQRRQGINRLDDYVMSAGQRRAGSRALDVAAMEQIPLSDLRFDTQKGQLYNQIAQSRLQGNVYDATGATARDDKLDQNRDAYYSALSENLSNLGTQTQNFAKNMGQKRTNQLQELAYLNNMSRAELDEFIIKDGQIVKNPDYIG